MEDSYTQPFKIAIEGGRAAGIMYACNKVNGVPAVASTDLATRLRSWGFTGYRTTDGGGIGHMANAQLQNYTTSVESSIRLALQNGESDIDDGGSYKEHLIDSVEAGLNISYVQRALFNTFRIRFRLGLFDPPESQNAWSQFGMNQVDTSEARQLNQEASRQSLILLQNNGSVLPFNPPSNGDVVVIGPSANSTRLLGSGHYARNLAVIDGFETGGFPGIPQAIQSLLRQKMKDNKQAAGPHVRYVPGIRCTPRKDCVCTHPIADEHTVKQAVAAAKTAAQVVLVLGLQSREPCDSDQAYKDGGNEFNPCGYEAEQHDRPNIALPKLQERLALAVLRATKAANVPTAVVLVHGGGLGIENIKAEAPAILDAHYPGETTGAAAVAEVLYGDFSPAGEIHTFFVLLS